MAAANKMVEVLCQNGKRQKVKTKPAMTVLQILEEVCDQQKLDVNQFDLKHLKKVLPATSMMRYLNLTNNAKLEMVPAVKARKASMVKIVIQTEDGERHQNNFTADTTLLQILEQLNKTIEKSLPIHQSVCIYMGNEYKSRNVLNTTSLKNMGIGSGSALIRHLIRETMEDDIIDTETMDSNPQNKKQNESPIKEPIEKKLKLESTPVVNQNEVTIGSTNKNTTNSITDTKDSTKPTNRNSDGNQPTNRVTDTKVSANRKAESTTNQLHSYATGPPPRSVFPETQKPHSNNIFTTRDTLQGPKVQNYQAPARNEFSNFKFPDRSTNVEDIVPIDPAEMKLEVKLSMACERETIIFNIKRPSSESGSTTQDLDESFFKVTVDDLRKRLTDLKSSSNENEKMLMTKSLRQKKELERISCFPKVAIRFQFPDKTTIQGIFRPLETVSSLKEFLSSYLLEDMNSYELFTTPPKYILKDKNETLYHAKLIPAAIIYVSSKRNADTALFLKPEHYNDVKTYDEAQQRLDDTLRKASSDKNSPTTATTATTAQASGSSSSGQQNSTFRSNVTSTSNTSNKYDNNKNAPKWFKGAR